ncbi:thioesterase [Burkholderia vietnamiensis]|jgi:pimeloyl-ACP methyl ester carboxylesterase|uniref:alpha/beta fold hydrolase n=1 Tax=Burkholderia cepacia complex TaxID=87882 RepID=UPI000760FD7E|nr:MULTISPECIES: alpha/beta hydrolase [Burkholderia cepacia complex]KVS41306.1 thioesterase [Burkholderia vietnamiensis]MBU9637270.1 alpha/beta hydrolase [Burkholderia multivorans]PRF09799.1 alpha/beta hydrolase [Burkholderia multivorans]PRG41642.1 alpha/beta hydrolase [Burkholderia multivorans]
MAVAEINHAKVSYQVDGHGPGLVLVHGTGGNGESNWGHLVERFATTWTVVRPDYAGSGATVDDGQPLSVPILAAQVVGAARAAGAVPFDMVGFSLGASVAAYVAAEYPDDLRALVLLAGFASGADSRMQLEFGLWRDLIHTDRRAMARLVLLTGFSPAFLQGLSVQQIEENIDDIVIGNQWEGMARQVALDLSLDVREQVKRINKPTLVIGCTQDHMVPTAHARALAATIPGAQYAELESGHLAPLERPDEFVQLVADFLRAGKQ